MSYSTINKAIEVFQYAAIHGQQKAKKVLEISDETFNRYMRAVKDEKGWTLPLRSSWLEQIGENFSDIELQAIAKGGRLIPGTGKVPIVSFEGRRVRFGAMTDLHIGHKRSSRQRIEQAFDEFKREGVEFVVIAGDITEGMSHRPGHIYELDHIGYDAQKTEAIDIFAQYPEVPIYAIDGNHDRWYLKSNGALIVKDIADSIDNFQFLGHDEGDISLNGKVTIKLWHGEDGNSYALSYRLQKIIESLSGGEKPNILIAGHVHKYVNIFERNVWAVSAGCIQAQTSWMRGKRLAAHPGFCVADVWITKNGVSKFTHTWYPFYA